MSSPFLLLSLFPFSFFFSHFIFFIGHLIVKEKKKQLSHRKGHYMNICCRWRLALSLDKTQEGALIIDNVNLTFLLERSLRSWFISSDFVYQNLAA